MPTSHEPGPGLEYRPAFDRVLWLLAGTVFGPFAVMSVYLVPLRPLTEGVVNLGAMFALLGIGVGLACLARLPWPLAVRMPLALVYVPFAFIGLVLYCLWFVAVVLGEPVMLP